MDRGSHVPTVDDTPNFDDVATVDRERAHDGPGRAESNRETVVEFGFSRAERGTGFGLSIVKQIVEAHRCQIRTTSGSDGGARFESTGLSFETDRPTLD